MIDKISIYEKEKIKEILNNIEDYFIAIITTCHANIVFDKYIKKYKILNDISYPETYTELVNKNDLNHYENKLNIHNDTGDSWYCNEIDIYKINDVFKENLKLYLNDETDSIWYSEEYDDVYNTLELEKQFFNANEEFNNIADKKNNRFSDRGDER